MSTSIPEMRKEKNVRANIATSDGQALAPELMEKLKEHRWERQPTEWSQ